MCSALALVALVCFALLWLRRRKKRKSTFHRALRSRTGPPPHDGQEGESPTPLISPTGSAVGARSLLQTPPLRLRDRKFLPSILRPGSRSPSPPLTPLTPPPYSPQPPPRPPTTGTGTTVFPASPICSPTTNKLIPRQERAPRAYVHHATTATSTAPAGTLLAPVPVPVPAASGSSKSSLRDSGQTNASSSGSSSYGGPSSLRHEIPIAMAQDGPSTLPARPLTQTQTQTEGQPRPRPLPRPRLHDAPLDMPDLIAPGPVSVSVASASSFSSSVSLSLSPPLSPPPNRALPRPPPPPPPDSPPASRRRPRAGGSASAAPVSAGVGVGGVPGKARGVSSASSKSLRHGHGGTFYHHSRSEDKGMPRETGEEAEGDARGSWGSWSGTEPGVCFSGSGGGDGDGDGIMARGGRANGTVGDEGGGKRRQTSVSPRTSESGAETVTGETVVSVLSREPSSRDDVRTE